MTDQAEKLQVILADPDTTFCVAARRALERQGLAVTLAHDGADLLARFSPDRFDVALVGVNLRFPNGLDILHRLRKNAPSLPVILLCDEDSVALAEKGVAEGAFAFVQKADDLDELADLIGEAVDAAEDNKEISSVDADTSELVHMDDHTHERPLHLVRELTRDISVRPLSEILQLTATDSARLLNAAQGVILFPHSTGYQIATNYESHDQNDPIREFIERPREGFAARVANAGKTLIDALPFDEHGYAPIQFVGTPMYRQKQLVGILVAFDLPTQASIDLERITWFEFLAAQAALAIEFARLKEANEQLLPEDTVTGALKRQFFIEMADREFRRSWRYNHPLTTILVDVDGMSILNLKHGREFGDVVLREVANSCRNVIRSVDLIGRYDDDALVLLLLMTGADGAHVVAERLRVGINSIRLGSSQGLVQITSTIGVCVYPRNGCASIFDLISMSQQAQQSARRIGPNQIGYC